MKALPWRFPHHFLSHAILISHFFSENRYRRGYCLNDVLVTKQGRKSILLYRCTKCWKCIVEYHMKNEFIRFLTFFVIKYQPILAITFWVASLPLEKYFDYPTVRETTVKNIGKNITSVNWGHINLPQQNSYGKVQKKLVHTSGVLC